MCYFNRLTRVARCLADYPEWLQFCWDFVKPPILTGRQSGQKLQCLYGNPIANNFFQN